MIGNYLICKSDVLVEGESIGGFTSFTSKADRKNITSTAEVSMPFYTVLQNNENSQSSIGKNTKSYNRFSDDILSKLKIGAYIEVVIWYESGIASLGYKQNFEHIVSFRGYIREVVGGFPTKIKCEDLSFPLRFGTINQTWAEGTPIATALKNTFLPTANKAFADQRAKNNLTYPITKLFVADDVMDAKFTFQTLSGVSPHYCITKIMDMFKFYATVRDDNSVWVGVATPNADATSPNITLSTALNVVNRNLVSTDQYFENYTIEVNYVDNGHLKTYRNSAENGELVVVPFLNTKGDDPDTMAKKVAENALKGLRMDRNKGTITTLPYPQVKLFDYLKYEDTLFSKFSGNYYVIGLNMSCDDKGYRQVIEVTNTTLIY